MMEKILLLITIFSITGFCYLPVYMNYTPTYNATNVFYADASASTINSTSFKGVNESCVESSGTHILSVVNSSNIWNGNIAVNASGSWNCTATAYNTTVTEVNSSVFTISCPTSQPVNYLYVCYSAITLSVDQNTTYFNIGDNVTIWALESNTTMTASMYLYSADNHTYPFIYSVLRNEYYVYYTVKQQQEILVVQSFTSGGIATGVGEYTLTYNPSPPTPGFVQNLYTQAGYILLLILGAGLMMVMLVIAGPIVLGFVLATIKGER